MFNFSFSKRSYKSSFDFIWAGTCKVRYLSTGLLCVLISTADLPSRRQFISDQFVRPDVLIF